MEQNKQKKIEAIEWLIAMLQEKLAKLKGEDNGPVAKRGPDPLPPDPTHPKP